MPFINSNAGPQEIADWKKSEEVAKCYRNLFTSNESGLLPLIIAKTFNCKNYSDAEFAYVVAACKIVLSPKYDTIQLKEKMMKNKVNYYVVGSVINFIRYHEVS